MKKEETNIAINNQLKERQQQEAKLTNYEENYNAQRQKIGLYPIPKQVQITRSQAGSYAKHAFIEWRPTTITNKTKAHWKRKTIYYNEAGELIEEDFFIGKKRYTIFDMAKEDSYTNACIQQGKCPENIPTVWTNETLEVQYNHSKEDWKIIHTTVNPKVKPDYQAEREQATEITKEAMVQLLEKWKLL